MELDFRYNQQLMSLQEMVEKGITDGPTEIKPYQELVDYFEANKSNFSYQDFVKNVVTPQGNTMLTLSDGTKILVGNGSEVINIAIHFPNNTKFMGMWTKLASGKEFIEKSRELAKS